MIGAKCQHRYAPKRWVELRPNLYLVSWRCKKCGRIYSFKTRDNWTNATEEQAGRTLHNRVMQK